MATAAARPRGLPGVGPDGKRRPYLCRVDGCARSFCRLYGLRRHLRSHTGEPPVGHGVAHVCDADGCMRSFTRVEHLKRHMRVHTGERPFRWCAPCLCRPRPAVPAPPV